MKQTSKQRSGVAPGWMRIDDDNGMHQYQPAIQPHSRQVPMLGEVLPPAPTQPANLLHAWQQPVDGIQEQTSAWDRAKSVVMRSAPLLLLVGLLASAGALIAWVLGGTVPSALTFLVLMAVLGGLLYRWESHTEYSHSRAGVERLRITQGANIEMAKIEHEAELRRMALDAYIRLMERRETDADQ
jgi:hypothetical protein